MKKKSNTNTNIFMRMIASIQRYAIQLSKDTIKQRCEAYLEGLVTGIEDKQERLIVQTVLKNDLHYILNRDVGAPDLNTKLVYTAARNTQIEQHNRALDLSFRVITNTYRRVQHIIGIQPMTGPVGLWYSMVMKKTSDEEPVNQMVLEIVKRSVAATSRKFKTYASVELKHDLCATHGVDFSSTFTDIMGNELSEEIVQGIIHFVASNAKYRANITNNGKGLKKTDIEKIDNMAVNIARDTRRGSANVIYINPHFKITHVNLYQAMLESERYTIIEDHAVPEKNIILGYKGAGHVDVGIAYCPYIMVISGGIAVNAETYQPQETLITRFALVENIDTSGEEDKTMNPYYGVITILDK